MSFERNAPINVSGGSPPAGYSLITGWGSINDPDSLGDTGTGLSSGTWTFVSKVGTTAQYDGTGENLPCIDIPLTTLFSDWSDTTDRLDLCLEVAAMPLTTAKWGLAMFVADNTYANRATYQAKGVVVFPNSATVIQAGEVGAASNATANNNGTNTDVVQQLYGTWTWDSGGVPRVTGRTKRPSAQQEINVVQAPPTAFGAAANRRIFLAAMHVSAVGGAVTLSARVYARRVRTTGPFV